jgi:hypothetical protein
VEKRVAGASPTARPRRRTVATHPSHSDQRRRDELVLRVAFRLGEATFEETAKIEEVHFHTGVTCGEFGSDIQSPDSGPACGGGCCTNSDCRGTCQSCSTSHTCVAVVNADDPNGRCLGTCDATGACKSKKGQSCQTVTSGCASGTTCLGGTCSGGQCQPAVVVPSLGLYSFVFGVDDQYVHYFELLRYFSES